MMLSGASRDRFSSRRDNVGAHHRDKVGTSATGDNLPPTAEPSDGEHQHRAPMSGAFSSFATLGTEDAPEQVDEDEDFGGLMVRFSLSIRLH